MALVNIVDHRKNKYQYRTINAIVEAAWHDNSIDNSDQSIKIPGNDGPDYAEMEHISLTDAIKWANEFENEVTLYIYDLDGGIYEVSEIIEPKCLEILYKNWRGEESVRKIIPKSVRYDSTKWHPEPQWLLLAFDLDKKEEREFAMKDFKRLENS